MFLDDEVSRIKPLRRMITIRMPDEIHQKLKKEASENGMTLQQLCMEKLARPLETPGTQGIRRP